MITGVLMCCGWDSTGKTEIAKTLAYTFGMTYFKNKNEGLRFDPSEDPRLAFKYETQLMFNVLEQFSYTNRLVLDRSIPSEFAYAKALNRPYDEDLIWYYDEKFAKLGAKIIYCYKTEHKNFSDEHVDISLKEAVVANYEEYLARTKMKYVKVDTTSEDLVK